MVVCTGAMLIACGARSAPSSGPRPFAPCVYYGAAPDQPTGGAKLNSAMAQLSDTNGTLSDLARSVENRHAALAMLLATEAKGSPGFAPLRSRPRS